MPSNTPPPDFKKFARWVHHRVDVAPVDSQPRRELLAAARAARDNAIKTRSRGSTQRNLDVLQLLAAASADEGSGLPELMTVKGFRVTLAYDEGDSNKPASICVLVQCPPELLTQVQGQTAYLWSESKRYELGQFDADGKAIGPLPAGIQVTLADFEAGNVKLEAPGGSADE
jgi:hypothetical protein